MKVNVLQNEEEYDVATARIYELMQTEVIPDSEAGQELQLLVLVVEEYENKHYPVPPVLTKTNRPLPP